jgi:hypothetical protein
MTTFSVFGAGCHSTHSAMSSADRDPSIATYARFVPERSDDFAWENDRIAFRAYGPALRENAENSGFDAWLKRVPYPIIDKWYDQHLNQEMSYHKDHGEGLDNYKVGSTAGSGGTGLWLKGQREPLETFTRYEIHLQSPEETVFTLYYAREIEGVLYAEAKTISIELGRQLFQVDSLLTKDGQTAANLPICVGLTTQAGKAKPYWDRHAGWIATWESLDDSELGTGARMHPSRVESIVTVEGSDASGAPEGHIFLIGRTDADGRIQYEAGYAWAKAKLIRSAVAWAGYLATR